MSSQANRQAVIANRKALIHAAGVVLSLSGVLFVCMALTRRWDDLGVRVILAAAWPSLACLAAVYGTLGALLALSWRFVLSRFDVEMKAREAVGIYGVSQIGKYVPGNIAQFASRQAIAVSRGFPGSPLLASQFVEVGLQVMAALAFSPLLLAGSKQDTLAWWAISSPCAIALVSMSLRRFAGRGIALGYLVQIAFLLGASTVFVCTLSACMGGRLLSWQDAAGMAGAYAASWLAGMLTPGAPAGLGVREFFLINLLGTHVPHVVMLEAVMISRLVTSAGDVVFFLLALLLEKEPQR